MKTAEWGNWGDQNTAKHTAEQHGCQRLRAWRVISMISISSRQSADKIDSAVDNLSVESDSQDNQQKRTDTRTA